MKIVTFISLVALFFFSAASRAASPELIQSLTEKLDQWNVEEAWTEVKDHLGKESKEGQLSELASLIAFHRGDYQEALKLMKSAVEAGGEEERRKSFVLFMEQTLGVVTPLKRFESQHFIIRLDEKQDGILADYLTDTLETTYQFMAKQYGFQPREKIRIEVFPDAQSFYYASSLSSRDIENGAVGIAKFNKLMVLSPRALVHGYRWLDAISHEYMHYLIFKMTANKAPIWFHEGLAKYEETKWRGGPSYFSLLYQTLLSRALSDQRLIRFERMEPSLVRLETAEEIQLAYAQSASAIDFIITKVGEKGLKEVMRHMATSGSPGASESIKEVLGLTFGEFEERWKEFLASRGFKETGGVSVRHFKIKEGKTDEERLDLEEIKSVASRNRTHLGDRLKERGRMSAAVLEYRRALADTPDSVPLLNRLSSSLMAMNKEREALEFLERAREISPDHPTSYTLLGQVYLETGDEKKAREAFQESLQINPFNPGVHLGLARAYEKLGDQMSALKEREIARKLVQ